MARESRVQGRCRGPNDRVVRARDRDGDEAREAEGSDPMVRRGHSQTVSCWACGAPVSVDGEMCRACIERDWRAYDGLASYRRTRR